VPVAGEELLHAVLVHHLVHPLDRSRVGRGLHPLVCRAHGGVVQAEVNGKRVHRRAELQKLFDCARQPLLHRCGVKRQAAKAIQVARRFDHAGAVTGYARVLQVRQRPECMVAREPTVPVVVANDHGDARPNAQRAEHLGFNLRRRAHGVVHVAKHDQVEHVLVSHGVDHAPERVECDATAAVNACDAGAAVRLVITDVQIGNVGNAGRHIGH
jgi:hypothetical protein